MRWSFLALVGVVEFHTTDAYFPFRSSNIEYKINKPSRFENEQEILRMKPTNKRLEKKYNLHVIESPITSKLKLPDS